MKNSSAECVNRCYSVSHNGGGGCGNAVMMAVAVMVGMLVAEIKMIVGMIIKVVVEMKKMVVIMDMLMMVEWR